MFICIDGSGPEDDAEYESAFAHSFLRQAMTHSTQSRNEWNRGPSGTGERQLSLANVARRMIAWRREEEAAEGDAAKVFLGGYSRGAAGVVHVAYLLEDMHIPVDGLFMFDAVDRSVHIGDSLRTGNVDEVPANVRAVYHARRNPAGESRESFSNSCTRAAVPASYRENFFLTTHGGMGGTLWGATGLDHAARSTYLSPTTRAIEREWMRRHAHLVEPFFPGTDGVDEALVSTYVMQEPSDGRTTLTMEQEEIGSQACIEWMWDKMRILGAVREGTAGRVVPPWMGSMPGGGSGSRLRVRMPDAR